MIKLRNKLVKENELELHFETSELLEHLSITIYSESSDIKEDIFNNVKDNFEYAISFDDNKGNQCVIEMKTDKQILYRSKLRIPNQCVSKQNVSNQPLISHNHISKDLIISLTDISSKALEFLKSE